MNRDCHALGGGMSKLKGQTWKLFIEKAANGLSTFDADDDEEGLFRPNIELQKQGRAFGGLAGQTNVPPYSGTKQVASSESSSGRTLTTNRSRGSVMRLDKADMGLYGICPETDPFYAVICDICSSVVKPQGLQKHMTNRHHSLINHTAKLNANGNNSASTTTATLGGNSKGSNSSLAEQQLLSNSYAATEKTDGMIRAGTNSEVSSGTRTDGKTIASSYGTPNDEMPLLEPSANSVPPVKIRSSGSGKVKSKSAKNASTHGAGSGSSSSSKSSSGYASNNSSLSSSFSKASISTNHTAAESNGAGATAEFGREFPASGAIGSSGVPLVLMSNCSGVLEKKATFAIGNSDRHCGVVTPDGKRHCTRPLTCKSHSLSQRRAVPGRSKTLDKLIAEMRGHGLTAASTAPKDEPGPAFLDVMESSSSSSTGFDVTTGDRRSTASGENPSRSSTSQPGASIGHDVRGHGTPVEGGKSSHHSSHGSTNQKLPSGERSKHKTSSRSHSSASGSTNHPQSKSSNVHHRQSSMKHGQSRETPAPPTNLPSGMTPQSHALSQQQQQQQLLMQNSSADMLGSPFASEDSTGTNSVLPDHAAIVMDPNTNLLKLSVSGQLHSGTAVDGSDSSQQYSTTNLMQTDGLTVTLPLSVISSMNLAGTNLVNMTHGTTAGGDVTGQVSAGNGSNAMLPPGVVDCGGTEQTAFIPAELIDQLPLVASNGNELHDPSAAYRLATHGATGTAAGQATNGLTDLTIPSYNDQINYTLQTFAQNLAQSADAVQQQRQHLPGVVPTQSTGQVDLVDSIDDIVPTINLLPTATNPLVIPQLQGDLADSIILTPNQLSSLSLVEQHFIDNISGLKAVSEIDPLTVNGPVDISKLMLLKKVDEEFLKERQLQQMQQQQQTLPHTVGELDEARGVKMWYSSLPKPLHVNNFQLRRLAGGYVMNRKLLSIRRNLLHETTGLDGKRLTSPSGTTTNSLMSSGTPHSPLGASGTRTGTMIGGRTGSDILLASLASPTGAGKGKANSEQANTMNGGTGALGSPTGGNNSTAMNRNSSSHRSQRRLILTPPQGRSEKMSCLLSNAYFKGLISSMQQTKEMQHHTAAVKSGDDAATGANILTDRTMHAMKRSASSLTTLSNKRMKIINNLHNSTAPPSVLLQGSGGGSGGKNKSKVL
uniref:SCA7 domain-containing protein n=1 Tax=Anopheles culicifacies TaxID=139723 RepID=A0A182MSX8_9DIPT